MVGDDDGDVSRATCTHGWMLSSAAWTKKSHLGLSAEGSKDYYLANDEVLEYSSYSEKKKKKKTEDWLPHINKAKERGDHLLDHSCFQQRCFKDNLQFLISNVGDSFISRLFLFFHGQSCPRAAVNIFKHTYVGIKKV